jgi:hypothetical protein
MMRFLSNATTSGDAASDITAYCQVLYDASGARFSLLAREVLLLPTPSAIGGEHDKAWRDSDEDARSKSA